MANPKIPIIQCARCNKPVDEISWQNAPWTPTYDRIFRVKCHGESETTRLSLLTIEEWQIEGGVAFTTKRLGKEEHELH